MHRHPVRALWWIAILLLLPMFATEARAGGALLQYAPSDAMGVLHVDVAKLRKTSLFRFIERDARARPGTKRDLAELRREAEIDPFRDIDGATLVLGARILEDSEDVAVALEGRYKESRILRYLTKRTGAAPEKKIAAAGPYYVLDRGRVAIAFRGRHVILASASMVERVLEKKDSSTVLAAVRAPVERDMIWLAARTSADARSRLSSIAAESLETLAVGLSIPDGGHLQVRGHFSDPQQAAALAASIRTELDEAARDGLASQLGLGELLKAVAVRAVAGDLEVKVDLTRQQMDSLVKAGSALAP